MWRNIRGFNLDAQIPFAKGRPFGQTNLEGTKRTIAIIFEFIEDVKMDMAWGSAGNANLGLAAVELIAWAQWVDTARREDRACAQSRWEKVAQTYLAKQGEVSLLGRRVPVKTCLTGIFAENYKS